MAHASETDAPSTKPARRLLVVEDDADTLAFLCTFLADARVAIATATTAAEAVAKAEALAPHAILLDVALPVIDGFAVYERLRRSVCGEAPRIVLMSAIVAPALFAGAATLGAYGALEKPFEFDELRRVVDSALGLEEETAGKPPRRRERPGGPERRRKRAS